MNKENFTQWLKAAGIRAIKTIAQTAIASIGVSATVSEIDWVVVASTAAVAGILSLLTSIAGLPEVKGKVTECEEDEGDQSRKRRK